MSWPDDRPVAYDPDKYWDEETDAWVAGELTGGGRYKQQLVVVNDGGHVFFGEV